MTIRTRTTRTRTEANIASWSWGWLAQHPQVWALADTPTERQTLARALQLAYLAGAADALRDALDGREGK